MPISRVTHRTRRRARALRREPTDAERALWRALDPVRRRGVPLRRQAPIGPFIADFAILSLKLVIEIDGGQHADNARDRARDAWLAAQGFRVVRLWNSDVLSNTDGCCQVIEAAIEEQRRMIVPDRDG
ncbi:endonuclease domain-containing protein [Microbaculum marinum]|uniref:Endonuclease domain-containing protein n=1 Tax=Microbaculum marinum TaxID=1764581 RepID=A0AAW9RTZ5_9HYPH